jgi:methylated-DNA-protein-cysteine methyltransferase related protein
MTYGQVARVAGLPRGARVVGYAMRGSGGRLPWQRVLGQKRAGLAHVTIREPIGAALQRQLLEKEGVRFRKDGTIDLALFGAAPPEAKPRAKKKRPTRRPAS